MSQSATQSVSTDTCSECQRQTPTPTSFKVQFTAWDVYSITIDALSPLEACAKAHAIYQEEGTHRFHFVEAGCSDWTAFDDEGSPLTVSDSDLCGSVT